MSNYSNYEATKEIIQRISKKIPQGIMIGNTTVGHIEWQMYLMRDYLKLDGTPLANASSDYDELLKFAQDNSLITADTTDKSLFKYDSTNDVLTLPDYIGLCLQGGNTIEEKEAGLPNIGGRLDCVSYVRQVSTSQLSDNAFNVTTGATQTTGTSRGTDYGAQGEVIFTLDASRSNPIYGNSTTVQPPAITLIPQIKYKKATVYEGIELGENYSTEEKRIGTWIDGKPLYQKTYTCNITVPSETWYNTNMIVPNNIKQIVGAFAGDNDSAMNYLSFTHNWPSVGYLGVFSVRNSGVTFTHFTIQYTKTTD